MTWKKWTITLAAVVGSPKVTAATVTATGAYMATGVVVMGALVEHVGPWALGLAGSTIVHAYFPPRSRAMAISSGVISAVLGGLGGPTLVELLGHYINFPQGTKVTLLTSFALAAAWPWAAPAVWDGIRRMWAGFVLGFTRRQGGDDGRA